MTQPEQAVGGAVETDSTPDPIEALADEWLAEVDGDAPAEQEEEAEEAALDEAEDEQDEEAELPPIDAPVSWTAEEKEAFASFPREAQEAIARRETERERFVQTKAQEAARARQEAEREALTQVAEIERQAVEQLQQLSASLLPQRPDHRLLEGNDADRAYYYRQQAIYEEAVAQQQQLQQAASQRNQRLAAYQQELERREAEEFRQTLADNFPEFLDPTTGAKLQQELSSIAKELGYPQELIQQARATDIMAMRKAAEWKAKADRLDALNAKKMETVRAHKGLPKVARPGSAQSKAQNSAARREAAWERVKQNRDPEAFADFLGL